MTFNKFCMGLEEKLTNEQDRATWACDTIIMQDF